MPRFVFVMQVVAICTGGLGLAAHSIPLLFATIVALWLALIDSDINRRNAR